MKTLIFKEIVDLSHEVYSGMQNVGGHPTLFWPVRTFDFLRTISAGKLALESRMMLMHEHNGTHLDAPRHFVENGAAVNEVPLENLILPGHLLDLTYKKAGEPIAIHDFVAAEERSGRKIGRGSAIVCWTGSDKDWGKGDFVNSRPYVPTDSAQWLVDRKISLFATDLIGIDDPKEWWWPTHSVWLENNICMVQQLCNLERLVSKEFLFICLPLKMRDGTGCPVRAAALIV